MLSRDYLLAHNIQPSKARVAILDYLKDYPVHPSADQLASALAEQGISLATIYNTLNLFTRQGAIRALKISDRLIRYDYFTDFHAHFVCTACGKLIDLPLQQPAIALPDECEVQEQEYFIYGLCPDCKKKQSH